MRQRLLTLALALGALLALYALLASPRPPSTPRVTRPLSTEAGPNGYAALQRWLAAAQVRTLSLRERYGRLHKLAGVPPAGNLLLSTVPHQYPIRDSERRALTDWIAGGNTLLLLAALSDTPDWSVGEGRDPDLIGHIEHMTGIIFSPARLATGQEGANAGANIRAGQTAQPQGAASNGPENARKEGRAGSLIDRLQASHEPEHTELVPIGPHPLLAGVRTLRAVSDYPSDRWQASAPAALLLQLAQDEVTQTAGLWLLPHGKGQIIVSGYGSLLTNKALGERDNARLAANIARWSLGRGGQVIIDDAHQGLVSFYDPQKFFGDERLHRALGWLFALWLTFVLGPRRLTAAIVRYQPLEVTGFVRATGGFMARVLRPASAAQALFANFFNELRRRLGLPEDATPLWAWLQGHPALNDKDLAELKKLYHRAIERRRIDLPALHNLLVRVRERLS